MGNTMIALLALVLAVDAGSPAAPTAQVAQAPLRDAKLVLADYAKAIGDEKAWKKHKSIRVKR